MKAFFGVVLALGCATSTAHAMTTDAATIVSLVKASPQLTIDTSIPPPGNADPKTSPYVRLARDEREVGGFPDANFASIGRLSDGTQVMAVPLFSGGSGGVFTQLIFVQATDGTTPFLAGYIASGGHLAVNITYHGIVAISPVYGPNEPNCCPSKYETRTYMLKGRTLQQISDSIGAKP
jgi:hypothetical protein